MTPNLLKWAWQKWWLVTLAWYFCAILVVVSVKHAKHKSMLTVVSNLVVGWPLVAPFALRGGMRHLKMHWRKVFAIALLAGLERNLTNSSLYKIGGSLKTALHGFNVIFTFFAAALCGADLAGRRCIGSCACSDNLLLTLSLLLISGGSLVTALVGDGSGGWSGDALGVTLQLSSSLAYAMKFSVAKLLFHKGADAGVSPESLPPSKLQIAFVVNPVTGLMGLLFLPFFEKSYALPPLGVTLAVAVCATGILIFELRLTELTSPLTVSVLAVLHNVVIVLFFCLLEGEEMSRGEIAGFTVSTLGSICYAAASKRQSLHPNLEQQQELRRSNSGMEEEGMEL
mmetsp:Transcript_51089/g.91743  ORF Transcript_51089/g.91743 Transcript_51089/m.91743 type:complete len:341 (-) Transcript_51089:159-1181(-)